MLRTNKSVREFNTLEICCRISLAHMFSEAELRGFFYAKTPLLNIRFCINCRYFGGCINTGSQSLPRRAFSFSGHIEQCTVGYMAVNHLMCLVPAQTTGLYHSLNDIQPLLNISCVYALEHYYCFQP